MFPSGALVKRELLTSLRRVRVFVWLVIIVLCCIAVIALNWPDSNSSPRQVASQMEEILLWLSFVLTGGCLLLIPAAAAGAIVSEREQDTLDLLRLSLVRSSGVVFGKLVNTLGLFFLLVAAAAPAVGATLFGVGIEAALLVQAFLVLMTVAITCALAGLASSAFFRRGIWAVIGAYVLAGMSFILPVVFGWAVGAALYGAYGYGYRFERFRQGNDIMVQFGEIISYGSLPAMATPVSALLVAFDGGNWSGWWVLLSIFLQIPLWILFTLLTMRWLRTREPKAIIDTDKPIDDEEMLRARREQFPYYLIDPLKRKKPIEDSRNPMFVREMRWGLFSRMTILIRLCLSIFALFFIGALFPVMYENREAETEIIVRWAAAQYFITMLFAPALVANAFTKERELGNLDMIRMTLLTPRQILLGKAYAGLVVLSPVLIAIFVASIPLLFMGVAAIPELITRTITGLLWAVFCVTVTVTVSLLSRRTLSALIVSYGIVAFTYLVLNGLINMLQGRLWHSYAMATRGEPDAWYRQAIDLARLINPTAGALYGEETAHLIVQNWAFTATIIFSCFAFSLTVLTRYRMQDR